MSNNNETQEAFKPFVPADKIMPELSVFSIFLGMVLAVVFGGANAYLGLRVGMTVSASIPAAVVSMGIIRGLLKRDSILENNMVQTIGSAGESLAAGCIFTIPALFIWYKEWNMGQPNYLMITCIALVGGILGVLFMIPLRKALIVNEHGTLPYPEGTACAEVLLAGEEGGSKARTTFIGLGVGIVYKFIADGLQLFPSEVDYSSEKFKGTGIGADILPALLGVGYIVGAKISSYMLSGAILGWFVVMPIIFFFGSIAPDAIMYPATDPISMLDHWGLWSSYLRYVGAGAVAFGGVYSLVTSLPTIINTFKSGVKDLSNLKDNQGENIRTNQDLPLKLVMIVSLVIVLVMGLTPIIPVGLLGAFIVAIFGFFFATVASRIVGIVGSSNSPVSGMAIATLIITAFIFKAAGNTGHEGMIATMAVGSIICIIAAISGDASQDLKTGYLVGATPKKQQIGEMIGVATSAVAIGGIMILLNSAWGFGSTELGAPQAMLMKLVVEGIMGGTLPWVLVMVGVGIGVTLAVLQLPILPIAIGLYLPIHLSTPIMAGGLIRNILDSRKNKEEKENKDTQDTDFKIESGILFASGLIAGEGLVGILLAVFAVLNINVALSADGPLLAQWVGLVFFAGLCLLLAKFSIFNNNDKK